MLNFNVLHGSLNGLTGFLGAIGRSRRTEEEDLAQCSRELHIQKLHVILQDAGCCAMFISPGHWGVARAAAIHSGEHGSL